MTQFSSEQITGQPDRIHVDIAGRFNVVVIRTEGGLDLHIYPRTAGRLWDDPFTTFSVDEAEIMALEHDMED